EESKTDDSIAAAAALLFLLRHSVYSPGSQAPDNVSLATCSRPCAVLGAKLQTPRGRGSARSAAHRSPGPVRIPEPRCLAVSVSVGRAAGSSTTLPRTQFLPLPTLPSIWRSVS